ncbi:phospholipid scramblase-related protein [Halobacteriovorax sp. ZH4_bin.1]|uniref:phospholipid scramblase-related protein n=1 Tax=unclassified Halobacteriovorax TaxID=2639665 RepID=UPI00372188BF
MDLNQHDKLLVQQVRENWELLGYETRNKYQFLDEAQNPIGYAAEQQKGLLGFIMRQFLGHWRTFDLHFFDQSRNEYMVAKHPFCFFFQRLEILDLNGQMIGSLQQRFSLITKKFDVLDAQGNVIMEMRSPIWKPWTYPFYSRGQEVACVLKKFSGLFSEMFTDRDNFAIDLKSQSLTTEERKIILATSVFIDLVYFERKAK